jgi:hypothetical protein
MKLLAAKNGLRIQKLADRMDKKWGAGPPGTFPTLYLDRFLGGQVRLDCQPRTDEINLYCLVPIRDKSYFRLLFI